MPYKTIGEVASKQIGSVNPFRNDLENLTIKEIREETIWPNEWNSVIGLIPYLKRLKGDLYGLEIGTGKGESAYLMLEECPNIKKLYTIDPFLEYSNWKETVIQENQDKSKELARKNLSEFGDRVQIISGDRENLKDLFDVNEDDIDFIFIDGADSYEQTKKDLDFVYPLLKPKGLIAGHNYQLDTVRNALFDWRNENKIRVPIQRVTNFSYFWIK